MEKYQKLKEIIHNAKEIVVFTGAGISVPSGIPDFRSSDGLYNQKTKINYSPEQVISHSFFMSHTKDFYEFYKDKMIYPDALPNEAHKYFANIEKPVTIITQNIDGLHQLAGSKTVYELHGSVLRNYCMKCHKFHSIDSITRSKDIPYCECGGIIKPDVVLYEENLDDDCLNNAINAIRKCDVLIVVGTSLVVQPAASLIRFYHKNNLIILNKDKTPYDYYADLVIYDDIVNVIKKIRD